MRWIVLALLFMIIISSGCLGEKTVIKANVKITERDDKPVIESMNVSTTRISVVEDYKQVDPILPGVYMKTIWNSKQIDYWRSVEYKGSGGYEIISELKTTPNKGDRVDVVINVLDSNGNEIAISRLTHKWG